MKEAAPALIHQEEDFEKRQCQEANFWINTALPAGFAETHSAEDVRKFVLIQSITLVLALLNVTFIFLKEPSFFVYVGCCMLVLEAITILFLRRWHDIKRAACLLVAGINFSTLVLCLYYGFVAEFYVWLGWVPKLLSLIYGFKGGMLGLFIILSEGSTLWVLRPMMKCPDAQVIPIDDASRIVAMNTYLLCFGLCVSVHEYCRSSALGQLYSALAEVKQNNRELRSAAEAKSMFLATTSHELRTPLHGMLALTESTLEQMPRACAYRQALLTISHCGKHLLALLNNVLDLEKVDSNAFALESIPFSVASEAEKICATFAATMKNKQIRLEKAFARWPAKRLGDPLRFRQVISNLLSNACKFTPPGGVIRVSLVADPNDAVRVEVSDTGPGIAPEAQANLFQDYVQADASISRRFGGTGLGLAISKRLVHAMGGQIGCCSAVGKGSTFWFVVPLPPVLVCSPPLAAARSAAGPAHEGPLADVDFGDGGYDDDDDDEDDDDDLEARAAVAAVESSKRRTGLLKGKRVLVVDDNAVNRKVCLAMLRSLGCETQVVPDGQACLDLLRATGNNNNNDNHDDDTDKRGFDAVLMDFLMPVLDGKETTKRIRSHEREMPGGRRRLPIIGQTGMPAEEAVKLMHEADMDDWIPKPYDRAQLAATLARWTTATHQKSAPKEIN